MSGDFWLAVRVLCVLLLTMAGLMGSYAIVVAWDAAWWRKIKPLLSVGMAFALAGLVAHGWV